MESIKDVYMISLDALDLNMLPISQKLNEGRVVILGSKSSLGLRNKEYYELEIKTNDTREGEENKKLDSSPILYKAEQVKDKVVDGGRFKATELNFNTVTEISSLFEYCMICDQIFAIEKRSFHLNSDLHCENLLQKLPDEYGIRKVNNTQDHCILCNYNFNNYEVHINSEEHITNFKNMIIPDKCKKTAEICYNFNADKINVNTKSQNSEILKSNESKSSTDTNGHTAPLNNNKKKTEEIDECTDNIETGTAVNIELDHGDAIKTDKMDNATDSKVIDAANAIKTAVPESKQHKDKISFNKTEEIDEYTDKIETGNAVNIERGNGNAIKTVKPGNAVNIKLGYVNAIKTVESGDVVNGKLGNVNAINTIEPSNAVNVELDHSNAIKSVESGNAIDNKVVEAANCKAFETVYKCGRLYIPITGKYIRTMQPANVSEIINNNVNNMAAYNKENPHMLKLRQKVDTKVKETSNLHYQMVKIDTKNFVTCIICNVDIMASDGHISTHIEGETHKNNYSEFCTRNLLVTLNSAMYCTVCVVYPGVGGEITHCIGKKHKKNLENIS
ncbi:unnamed protein product [Euphydryas editha]|uniref:U1-type domain-containing protein n=1 Tax=Euphydryas editha TaxID=104508 RepID=A0AAU9T9W2_EUPED|nr:unnamed protein product [Euphydryas editha]